MPCTYARIYTNKNKKGSAHLRIHPIAQHTHRPTPTHIYAHTRNTRSSDTLNGQIG